MLFRLRTSGWSYDESEKLRLSMLGFKFDYHDDRWPGGRTMSTVYAKTEYSPFVEFRTIDEIVAFVREWGQVVVSDGVIEIYDSYRE